MFYSSQYKSFTSLVRFIPKYFILFDVNFKRNFFYFLYFFVSVKNYKWFLYVKCFLNFIYLFMAVLGLHCCVSFSLVLASRGHSLVVVHRLSLQ